MIFRSIQEIIKKQTCPDMTVLIPTYNNPSYLRLMMRQLFEKKMNEVVIVDNNSSCPEMCGLLDNLGAIVNVVRKKTNEGPMEFYLNKDFFSWLPKWFIVTDPDIGFNEDMPDDFLEIMKEFSEKLNLFRVGLALDREMKGVESNIKQIMFRDSGKTMYDWEGQFWACLIGETKYGDAMYDAPVDTTFCLINKENDKGNYYKPAVRIAGRFTAQHYGWYKKPPIPEAENKFYLNSLSGQWSETGNAVKREMASRAQIKPKILISITNFDMSDEADRMKLGFLEATRGTCDVVLIDASSKKRPSSADEVIPNDFYTGLWNKSASIAIEGGYDSLFFIASDVQVDDYRKIIECISLASSDSNIGVCTPSLKHGSRCAYDQCLRREQSGRRECDWIEGFCFLAKTQVLRKIFPVVDNKYGWQIDRATCAVARNMGFKVVVDDGAEIFHPHSNKRINRKEALDMGNTYFQKICNQISKMNSISIGPNKDIVVLVNSVNMDDYLSVTIKNNRKMFERYYVVTSQEDEPTINVCKNFDAEVVTYDGFFNDPRCSFNKAGGIRHAQKIIHERHRAKWVILIDVDIILPDEIASLDTSEFTKRWMYGMARVDAHTYDDYKSRNFTTYHQKFDGYFQMYHNKSFFYPEKSINASWCDIYFRDKFPRRILIPDMRVIHIGRQKMHWNGRDRERLKWGDS